MFSKMLTASLLTRTSDEDLCSQFNYIWTAWLLACMGLLITLVQYVGEPIQCWCPAEMPEVQCNYTKALCWVKENYYVSEREMIQFEEKDRHSLTVSYYPWVPWILLFMAAMLNLPHTVWQSFAASSGLDLKKFVNLADSHDSADNLAKILRIWQLKGNAGDRSGVKKHLGSLGFFRLGKHNNTYLCGLTILVKLFYFLISIGLHISLNTFIDENFLFYGFDVVENFLKGIPQNSVRFPKQTICDMKIRQMANINTYSIQCILPINLFNEKIFIFLWFWLPILIMVNTYSLVKWTFQLLSPSRRRQFVEGYVDILFHLLKRRKSKRKHAEPKLNCSNGKEQDIVRIDDDSKDSPFSDNKSVYASDVIADPGYDPPRSNSRAAKRANNSSIRNLFSRQQLRRRHSTIVETSAFEVMNEERRRRVGRITKKMLKYFGHDGIVVFRVLEHAVGIVIANEIFQELYEQLQEENHYH